MTNNESLLTPGKMLRRWRVDHEKSQTELAALLGTSQQVISNIESGDTVPKLDFIQLVKIKCNLDLTEAEMPVKAKAQTVEAIPMGATDAFVRLIDSLVEQKLQERMEAALASESKRARKNYRAFGSRAAFNRANSLS
jgi:transcriptional regulator with XRE-family HTH domain